MDSFVVLTNTLNEFEGWEDGPYSSALGQTAQVKGRVVFMKLLV